MKAPLVVALCFGLLIFRTFSAETNYQSPIGGKSYRADWQTYQPTNATATNGAIGRVRNQGIRLLATQDAFSRGVTVSELADFIRDTEKKVDESLGKTNDSFELVVQTQLTKEKRPFFEIASKGNVSNDLLQRIYENFGKLPDYRSRADTLQYEIRFAITKKP